MPDAELLAPTVENVRVVVRVRPMDQREKLDNGYNCLSVDPVNNTVAVTRNNVTPPEPPRVYAYDAVFESNTSQMDIYVQTASPIVEQVLKGYNGTIFAYGQTGTGKTYTMAGSNTAPELRGIIPNSFAHIFSHIAKAKEDEKFLVCVTYLEIYNEEVRDLLGNNPHQSLEVKERPDIGVFVKDLTGYVVHNADELEKIMAVGNKNRHIGATAMNTESSRSHAIFSITVESSKRGADGKIHVKMGKLHLVDLAGSERQSKTQATGTRLKEATKINQSLSVLGNVISALVDGKSTHIPYRNSKLTRLLQDSLGGNSKTVMIATIGPADMNYVETISTLRYANRAKNIENKTHVNSEPGDALLTRFQQEIDQLKKQLEESINEIEEEGDEEDDISDEELSDDTLTDPELDSLDPDEKKQRRKLRREEKVTSVCKIFPDDDDANVSTLQYRRPNTDAAIPTPPNRSSLPTPPTRCLLPDESVPTPRTRRIHPDATVTAPLYRRLTPDADDDAMPTSRCVHTDEPAPSLPSRGKNPDANVTPPLYRGLLTVVCAPTPPSRRLLPDS